jgi:hypothetical protein
MVTGGKGGPVFDDEDDDSPMRRRWTKICK